MKMIKTVSLSSNVLQSQNIDYVNYILSQYWFQNQNIQQEYQPLNLINERQVARRLYDTVVSTPTNQHYFNQLLQTTQLKQVKFKSLPSLQDPKQLKPITAQKPIRIKKYHSSTSLKDIFGKLEQSKFTKPQTQQSKCRVNLRESTILKVPFSALNGRGFQFEKKRPEIPEGNQHLNCNIDLIKKRNYQNDTMKVNKSDNAKCIKLHKFPSRHLQLPKHSQAYQKMLEKYTQFVNHQVTDHRLNNTFEQQILSPTRVTTSQVQQQQIRSNNNKKIITDILGYIVARPNQLIQESEDKVPYIVENVISRIKEKETESLKTQSSKTNIQEQQLFGTKAMRTILNQQIKFQTKLNKADKMKRIRLALLQTLNELKKLRISPNELMTNHIFPSRSLQKPLAKKFIQAAKTNDIDHVERLINQDKYLVYEFDNIMMTGLHWACKRGYTELVSLLLKNRSNPDSQDIVGRTPLYMALDNNYQSIVRILLFYQADPWDLHNCKYGEVLTTNNQECMQLISDSRRIQLLLRMTPANKRSEIWSKEQLAFLGY